ncbi:MAG: DnaJ domain-containing protein [Elusimicrobiales bacterium]|nr:DnaJ domain-containing protein [Elusimicrobiales bacterium]
MQNYYEILGIDRKADAAAIKQAYYRELKKYHPDTYSGASEAHKKFLNDRTKLINEAYSVLSDINKRRAYDASFIDGNGASGNDFFENIFKNINPGNFEQKYEEVKRKMHDKNHGPLAEIWNDVMKLWAYINDPKVPLLNKMLPLAALLYMVFPIDLIPDFVPFAGLGDDVAVILWVVFQYYEQLKNYGKQ